jgi:hypothetical protein
MNDNAILDDNYALLETHDAILDLDRHFKTVCPRSSEPLVR